MPTTGKADNAVSFTFDGPRHAPVDEAALMAAVEQEMGGKSSEPATPDVTSSPSEPTKQLVAAVTQATASPAAPAAEPSPAPASTEEVRTHKIVVDGQELEVTEADLKQGHMRLRDYTQKTQRVAERERQLEAKEREYQAALAQRDADLNALDQFLQNKQAIDAYIAKAFGANPAPQPQIDPNKPPTIQEVAEIARYNAEQVRLAQQREIDQAKQAAFMAQRSYENAAREKAQSEIDRHIGSLVDKFPELKKFEDIEDELIGQASKYPSSAATVDLRLADAKARLTEAAERKVAAIRAFREEGKKEAAIAAAKLAKTSPESPGGTPAKPAAGRKLTLDSKDRSARIDAGVEALQAFLAQNT